MSDLARRRVGELAMIGVAGLGLLASQIAPPAAHAAAGSVNPGSALAAASVATVGPSYGGLAITVTLGSASAYYQGRHAQATAAVVDAAALSGLTGASAPPLPGTAQLQADSTQGASTKSSGGPAVAVQEVSASPSPESGQASSHAAQVIVPGLVEIDGSSAASVRYTEGRQQAADASVTMNLTLGGGLVVLNAVAWHATSRNGAINLAQGTFTVGSLTVASTPLPVATPAQVTSSIASANTLLAPLGLSIIMPVESIDHRSGTATVGPLELRLSRSAITNALFTPLLNPAAQLELALAQALADGGPTLASVASAVGTGGLLAGLVLGILAGAGKVSIILGGANAAAQSPAAFTNPLGATSGGPPPAGDVAGGPTSSPVGQTSLLGGGGAPAQALPTLNSSDAAAIGGSGGGGGGGGGVALAAGPIRCTSTSPSGRPGCWRGLAVGGASALLIAGLVLFAADLRASRRRRVHAVEEVAK